MIAIALAILSASQSPTWPAAIPKTFQDLEIDKIVAYQHLKTYTMLATIKVTDPKEGTGTMLVTQHIDGDRSHLTTHLAGAPDFQMIGDGVKIWMFSSDLKVYAEGEDQPLSKEDPKDGLQKATPDGFKFIFTSGGPLQFACDPPPALKSFDVVTEGGEKLRRAVTTSKNSTGHVMTITQWFLMDKWIVKEFKIDGETEDGPKSVVGLATFDFKSKFAPNEFVLDPKLVDGFKKVPLSDLMGGQK